MNQPLVSVICPVRNAESYIEETIQSVLGQTYTEVELIIIDGKSTDGTVEIIRKYEDSIAYFLSEPDRGMYDALAKGFEKANGDIVCYLNAGDLLNSFALKTAAEVMQANDLDWVTGNRSICNDEGVVTYVDLPFRYLSSLVRVGSYTKKLPFIQQETTLWRRSLMDSVDFEFLKGLRYAGDYYLWWCFAERSELQVVSCPFGNFRKHVGQLSENLETYREEVTSFVEKRKIRHYIRECLELLLWVIEPRLRSKIKPTALRFDHHEQTWKKTKW